MSPAETPDWVAIIGNFGFPIAITIYLFIRFEKRLAELEKVITDLSNIIKEWITRKK
jgi:hypothetical protein